MLKLLLVFGKPLWYLVALALAARTFAVHGPHWRLPSWAVVLLATAARLAAGLGMAALLNGDRLVDGHHAARWLELVCAAGLVFWFLTVRIAFRRTPTAKLIAFALVAELMSAAIDLVIWNEVRHINMC